MKDIVYHGTLGTFDTFENNSHFGTYEAAKDRTIASLPKYYHDKAKIIPVILNSTTIHESHDVGSEWHKFVLSKISKEIDTISYINVYEGKGTHSYIAINPERIHILGSQKDIEGFKSFIQKDN